MSSDTSVKPRASGDVQGMPLTSSGLVPWPAESYQPWAHLWFQCSGTVQGSALLHSGAQWPHLQPEPHPCGLSRGGDDVRLPESTKHAPNHPTGSATQHPQGSQTDAPNEKQGLDLLLRTHAGGILLGLIFVLLFHADLHKRLRRRSGGEGR